MQERNSNQLSLARKLISENKVKRLPFLDLGNCGISDLNDLPELFECTWLQIINFGWGFYEETKWIPSKQVSGPSNSFEEFPPLMNKLTHIEAIYLRRLKINPNTFKVNSKSFLNLSKLDLAENEIDDEDILIISESLPNLKSLFLAINSITDTGVKHIAKNLPKLKQLSLWGNKLGDSGAIEIANNLSYLSELFLGKNQIGRWGVKELILKLRLLERLDFSHNKIDIADDHLKDAKFLKEYFKVNPFNFIVLRIIEENKNSKEKFIDLGNLGITDLNEFPELFDCNWIERLNLGKFYYQDINLNSRFESKNSGNNNQIVTFPENIVQLKNLKHLEVSHQKISLNGFQTIVSFLPNLLSLNLYGNFLEPRQISLFAEGLLKLQFLNLGKTNLHCDVSPITKNQHQLISLDLNNNKVDDKAVSIISNELKKLKYLDLSCCPFSPLAIDTISDNIKGLRYLNLSETSINKVKPLIDLPDLVELKVNNCPIKDCPADVWQTNDISVIRSYFEQIDKEKKDKRSLRSNKRVIKLNPLPFSVRKRDVKLILLGNSNAGKTTLVKFLTSGEFSTKRESTHGMEVIRWDPDEKRFPLLKDVTVSIWDFGGQDYYHESYKVFLSSNALFLVLWCRDSDRDCYKKEVLNDLTGEIEELAHFEKSYWLNTVRYYNGYSSESPLFLVQTKTDIEFVEGDPTGQIKLKFWHDDRERIAEKLHDEFEITESFSLGLKKAIVDQNPKEKRLLDHFIIELESILNDLSGTTAIPETWHKVRQEIWDIETKEANLFQKKLNGRSWISLDEFVNICSTITKGMLSPKNSIDLPKWLSRGGTLVHFENSPGLNDRVFLQPGKLSSEIYERLNKKVRDNNGELTFEKDDADAPIIKELLLDLGLIIPHPNSLLNERFIVPQYLPDKHPVEYLFKIAPKETWKASLWFKIPMFYYKRVLNHLLFYYASYGGVDTPAFFWKHAIIFIMDSHRIMIKGLYPSESNEGVIQLSVEAGNFKHHLEETIFKEIKIQLNKDHRRNPGENETQKVDTSENSNFDNLSFSPWLHVSVDGKNFIDYERLPKNEKDEIDPSELKGASISAFASLLNFKPEVTKKVFLSYSHQNTYWLNRLRVHLAGLKHSKFIEEWTDQEILPGERWDDRIKEQIEKADLFILLLTADFVASRYIWGVELPKIKEKIESHKGHLVFVLTEPFDFGAIAEISTTEMIPKDTEGRLKAISLWPNQESALEKVAIDIRRLIEKK